MTSFFKDHPIYCFFGATIGVLALKYPNRALFHEEREGVCRKNGWPIVGSLPTILSRKDAIHELFLERFTELKAKTIASSVLGIPQSIATVDPQNVEYVLKGNFQNYVKGPQLNDTMDDFFGHGIFNANGKEWRYQRKTASNIFNIASFRDLFTEVFVDQLKIMSDVLDQKENQVVDLHEMFYKFTLDSFIWIGFGAKLESLRMDKKTPFASAFDACQLNCYRRFTNPIWRMSEAIQNTVAPQSSTQAQLEIVNQFAEEIIMQRKQSLDEGYIAEDSEPKKDILSRFMETRNHLNQPLSNKELRDIVLNFIIAGRDTTAQALSWTIYNLILYPRIEKRLLEEINECITDGLMEDPKALYDVITRMVYAHAIFYEVLRLHPSVPNNQKYALEDDVWPDGTVIKKGDYIYLCSWAQGRCESVWGSAAKEFRPERWISPETGKLRRESQGQWPAFNGGPRTCLGQNLATLEALIAIIHLVKTYRFKLAPQKDITYQISLTLPMKNGLKVFVERR